MAERKSFNVFLSYNVKDRDWASAFASSLNDSGVRAWFDMSSIQSGERWQDRIQEALRESRFFVLIVSSHSIQSPWTFFELGAAVADKKTIIPVATEDINPEQIPLLLRQFQFLRESSPLAAGKRVAAFIEQSRGSES